MIGSGLPAERLPVTVVIGGRASGKGHLIAQLRARRPPGARWALMSNAAGTGAVGPQEAKAAGDPRDEYFPVPDGCACCVAGPAFRTALVRLLRAGPWQALHIESDAAGHPHRLVDQLRTPPFDRHLVVARLLLTLDDAEAVAGRVPDDLLGATGRLSLATDVLLRRRPDAPADSPLTSRLRSAPPWPRREAAPALPDLPGLPDWRTFSLMPDEEAAAGQAIVQHWPAERVAQRPSFKALLAGLANDSAITGITGFQALVRTPRAWYCWQSGRGRGPGSLTFDLGPAVAEAETAWRVDSRICLWLAAGAPRELVRSRLEGLQQAFEAAADA